MEKVTIKIFNDKEELAGTITVTKDNLDNSLECKANFIDPLTYRSDKLEHYVSVLFLTAFQDIN